MHTRTHFNIKMPSYKCRKSPGRVLPLYWVIWMCRHFDPLFWHSGDWTRSFWGTFLIHWHQNDLLGVLKLPILTEFDLFGPKFHFSIDLLGSNFQRPAAHPHRFLDRVPPPGRKSHCTDKNDGLVQDCSNSSALAMELLQSCSKPSRCTTIGFPILVRWHLYTDVVPWILSKLPVQLKMELHTKNVSTVTHDHTYAKWTK